jgi:hypothetical protein
MSACHWGVDDDDDELAIGVGLSSRRVTYTILNQHKTYMCVCTITYLGNDTSARAGLLRRPVHLLQPRVSLPFLILSKIPCIHRHFN